MADNLHKWEITESESLLIGRNFGVGTDMQTGPNGNLFVVSLSNGAVYKSWAGADTGKARGRRSTVAPSTLRSQTAPSPERT